MFQRSEQGCFCHFIGMCKPKLRYLHRLPNVDRSAKRKASFVLNLTNYHQKLNGTKLNNLTAATMTADLPNKQKGRELDRVKRTKDGVTQLPRKKFYRQRAHANPFSDHMLE